MSEFRNRSAFHDYFIEDTYIAGMVLVGTEVKSLRAGKVSFNDSYCLFNDGELYVKSLHISEYSFGTTQKHEPLQERKLLLNKKELKKLEAKMTEKGYTIVPLHLYLKRGRAKVEVALARGKRQHDKRQALAEREAKRDIARAMRDRG